MPGKPTIPRVCETCQADFLAWSYQIRRGTGRFCSNACRGAALRRPANRICDHCGGPFRVGPWDVRTGRGRFCSDACRKIAAKPRLTHGEASITTKSPEYMAWGSMKTRCQNVRHRYYAYYGGRGITVYPAWSENFEAFLADVGRRPSPKHSLDRIDNDGNYEPDNVRWTTQSEQQRNKRCFAKGPCRAPSHQHQSAPE